MTLTSSKSSLKGRQIMTSQGEVLTILSFKGYEVTAHKPGIERSEQTFCRSNVELIPEDEPYSVTPDSDTTGFVVLKDGVFCSWQPNRESAMEYARRCNVGAFRAKWMKERGL